MKTNPFKNLLKTTLLIVAVLLSFVGFGKNSIDKSSNASSFASVSETPFYKWEGLSSEKEISYEKGSISPVACMTLSTTYTNETCSGDGTGQINLTISGADGPFAVNFIPPSGLNRIIHLSAGTYTASFSPLPAGTYTFEVYSADGCSMTTTVTIGSTYTTPTLTVTGTTQLCVPSQTTALTISGASTYTWNTGANTNTIVATAPVSIGAFNSYSVQGTSTDGCVSHGSFATTSLLSLGIFIDVSSVSPICASQSVTLVAEQGTSYTWSPGGATTNSIVVSPTVTTTYTLSGIDACGNAATATTTVTSYTNSPPSVSISGTSTVCPQPSYTWTASGANAYSWYLNGGDGTISSSSSYTVSIFGDQISPQNTATLSVVGTNTVGCADTVTITVTNLAPDITVPFTNTTEFIIAICTGGSYTINASLNPGTSTYTWSPSLSTLNPVVSPTVTTTYTLSATNSGCVNSEKFTLTVDPTPTITLTSPINICSGTSTYTLTPVVTGTVTNTIYDWSPAINLSSTSAASTVASSITSSSSYTLTVTNFFATGNVDRREILTCPEKKSVSFNITTPTVSISGNTFVCPHDDIILTASGASTYTWAPTSSVTTPTLMVGVGGFGTTYDGQVFENIPTTFTVTGTDVNGCVATATTIVTAPVPTFTYSLISIHNHNDQPLTICSGTNYTINAQVGAGETYTWTPDLGSTLNPVITPTASINYYTLTVSNGSCTAAGVGQIDVTPSPTISLNSPINICAENSYTLVPTTAGTNTNTTYNWDPPAGLSNTTTSTTVATPSVSTSYTLIADNHIFGVHFNGETYVNGFFICSDTASTLVNVTGPPPLPIINYSSICDSNYTTLSIPSPNSTYTYTWNGPCYTGTGSSANVNSVGIYTVSVINSCGVTTTNTISVLVIGNIVAGFQTYINFLEEGSSFIHFENLSLGNNLIYQWTFGNGDTSVVINPNETFDTVGVFQVHLYDSDSMSCKDTASATVVLSGHNTTLIIPNSFTPNNDNVDDVFAINGTGVTNFKCQVSDKWGNFLYQWNNLNGSWNGIASNGHVFATGNYFYLLSYTDYYGNNQSRSGIVALKK